MTTFGTKLIHCRKLAGFSQAELADLCGSHQSRIAKWEGDQGNPTIEQLNSLVRGLRTRLGWLTSDYLTDPAIDEPAEARRPLTSDEALVWVLVQDLGAVEARRRLLGLLPQHLWGQGPLAAEASVSSGPAPAVRMLTRNADDLPDLAPAPDQAQLPGPTNKPRDPGPAPEAGRDAKSRGRSK